MSSVGISKCAIVGISLNLEGMVPKKHSAKMKGAVLFEIASQAGYERIGSNYG